MSNYKVTVLGAGLAGCEAALWLAGKGVQVELYEQKPAHFSPAHKSEGFAELICSNSLKAERLDSASGLLKEEMRRMGSAKIISPIHEKDTFRFIKQHRLSQQIQAALRASHKWRSARGTPGGTPHATLFPSGADDPYWRGLPVRR